jgi:hypothetical protein
MFVLILEQDVTQLSHADSAAGQDSLKWCGAGVIELGAGLGLPGIFLALQGAKASCAFITAVVGHSSFSDMQLTAGRLSALCACAGYFGLVSATSTRTWSPQTDSRALLLLLQVVLTDKSSTLPLLRDNARQNAGTAPLRCFSSHCHGRTRTSLSSLGTCTEASHTGGASVHLPRTPTGFIQKCKVQKVQHVSRTVWRTSACARATCRRKVGLLQEIECGH